MLTQDTQDLIKKHGWTYIPTHDKLSGPLLMTPTAVPECWGHDDHGIVWTVDEVLSIIGDEIDLRNERELDENS